MWAGLRPLVKSATSGRTADLSRRHRVTTGPGGVIGIAGGKLTTYREMAEDTVDEVLGAPRSQGALPDQAAPPARGGRVRAIRRRARRPPTWPGASARASRAIDALVAADASLGEPLIPGLPYLRAEAVHAVRHEMATTLDDVLLRRTRAHLFDRPATLAAAPAVAELLAGELGWDADEVARQLAAYEALVATEQADATLTATTR